MDATLDLDRPAAGVAQRRRYHLLVGANGWVADEWFPDLRSAVERAHAIEAASFEPGAGWRVVDLEAQVVTSSEREARDADRRLLLLFLAPVVAAFTAIAARLALA